MKKKILGGIAVLAMAVMNVSLGSKSHRVAFVLK
jgi:hypothetical protein